MRRVRKREQAALKALYDRYSGAVYSVAYRVLGDQARAEEVTQDVFMRLWDSANLWDASRGRLSSWLMTIARNAAIDRIRKENRRPDILLTPYEDLAGIVSQRESPTGEEWQRGHTLRTLIQKLPTEQAHLIELAYFGGMSHQDMSDSLNIPLGTVKTRLRLGLQKLRDMWHDTTHE